MFVNICGVDQLIDPRTSFVGTVASSAQSAESPVHAFGAITSTRTQREGVDLGVTFVRAEPGDGAAIEAMLERCSRRSRAQRFFRPVASAPHGYLDQTLSDRGDHLAFLILVHGQPIGLAELHRTRSQRGDLGLIVEDAYHGQGVGTAAYALLVDVARMLDVHTLTADVRVENSHVFKVLRRAGRTSVTRDHDVCRVEVDIRDLNPERGPLGP